SDRRHHTKRDRPVASGRVPVRTAVAASAVLLVAAAGLAVWLPTTAALVLALYCASTLLYSAGLKRLVLLDVVILAGLYALRVLALYIHSPEVHPLYKRPEMLWLLGPLLAYGILKLWLAGHRGLMHDDPIVFVVQSRWTYGLAAIAAAVLVAASI